MIYLFLALGMKETVNKSKILILFSTSLKQSEYSV